MNESKTGGLCWVCGGKVISETLKIQKPFSMMDIIGPGADLSPLYESTTFYCEGCKLVYRELPPPKPIAKRQTK